MNILEVALALAVAMLIFSTLSTIAVELLQAVMRARSKGLKRMLEEIYTREVSPRLQGTPTTAPADLARSDGSPLEGAAEGGDTAHPDGAGAATERAAFVKAITLAESADEHLAITTVSTMDFVRRLADTDLGKIIATRSEHEMDVLVDVVSEKYEEYGRRASELFRRRARLFTLGVSVVLAFMLNLNVLVIYKAMQDDAALARTVAMQADQVTATYEAVRARVGDAQGAGQAIDEELSKRLEEFSTRIDDAKALGLPIGWDEGWWPGREDRSLVSFAFLVWLLTTFLTGLLIGLGGPFWYDVVKRLQPVTELAGALVRQPSSSDGGDKSGAASKKGAKRLPDDPRVAFKQAAHARKIMKNVVVSVSDTRPGPRALRL